MEFRSIADMNRALVTNLDLVPEDVDLIIGIPRSGILPATILCLALNVQLADIESSLSGRAFRSGKTRGQARLSFGAVRHALVVDDSVRSGGSMRVAREQLAGLPIPKVTYCAVYGTDEKCPEVDFVFEEVPEPRAFEWNILHHPGILGNACVDIDGILCRDPTPKENDDGEAYRRFLSNPARRYRPTGEIHTIVTSRLEKYRTETEAWLSQEGIRYRDLRMLDLPDAETRRRLGGHGSFKAQVYRDADASLFIESEAWQAQVIADLSGKPVVCMDGSPRIIYGTLTNARGLYWRLTRSRRLRRLLSQIVGEDRLSRLLRTIKQRRLLR